MLTKQHAMAWQGLCMVHTELKAFPEARKAIGRRCLSWNWACSKTSSMGLELGGLDLDQERYEEALVINDKAKAVLVQHKEWPDYGALLNNLGICHKELP